MDATRGMLIEICHRCIGAGSDGERALLARAALIEEQFANPGGAKRVPDELLERRQSVRTLIRQVMLDDHVSRQDRRWLWDAIGEGFTRIARGYLQEAAPSTPSRKLDGYDLIVDPNGVVNKRAEQNLRRTFEAQLPRGDDTEMWIRLVGATLAIVGLLSLWNGTPIPGLGLTLGVMGLWAQSEYKRRKTQTAEVAREHAKLDAAIERATDQVSRQHKGNLARHEERVGAADQYLRIVDTA